MVKEGTWPLGPACKSADYPLLHTPGPQDTGKAMFLLTVRGAAMNTESSVDMKPEQRLALKLTLGFEKMGGKLLDICVCGNFFYF